MLILLVGSPANSFAAEPTDKPAASQPAETELDELLEGFDADPAPAPPEEAELDDLLDAFGDDAAMEESFQDAAPTAPKIAANRRWRLGGELSLAAAVNVAQDAPAVGETDWRGLSKLRTRLALELDVEPMQRVKLHASGYGFYDAAYSINGREDYTADVLDAYEDEVELTETYLLVNPLASVDFRFGRQIVVWGGSETLRVTDVLNPLDLREPGLTDLEYLRLPVTMSRLDTYFGPWRLTGMAIHESRFNKNPEFGSDFYPLSTPPPPEQTPANGGDDTEWALSFSGTFSGWDLALYAAEHFNDQGNLAVIATSSGPAVVQRHARLQMLGASANWAVGNWLLRAETAWQDGFRFLHTGDEEFSRWDMLAGIEYSGFTETTISLEAVNRHINSFRDELKADPDSQQEDSFVWAARIVREFFNDTLTATFLAVTYGVKGEDGAFQRLQVEYDLQDNLEVTFGGVLYQSGDLPAFRNVGDNDRVFAELAYHF